MRLLQRSRRLAPEERALIELIEAERAALERSDEELEYLDFGAGPSGETGRSAEEMKRGTPVTRRVGELCGTASKPPNAARMLFELIRERQPEACLELGTCLGISAAYQAAALELNGWGTLYTIEGAAPLAERAGALLDRLGLGGRVELRTGKFLDVLPDVLARREFDFAFVDGHHDERATLDYFELIRPRMRGQSVMAFDDVDWSDGMRRAWEAIRSSEAVASSWTRNGVGFVTLVAG
jgi:predicted O-methyltransferase YrrM